jgi:hypothetical protein
MEVEEDEFEKRNRFLYEGLKVSKVCVVPDSRILTIDKLPMFSIIEGNIKENVKSEK